MSQKSDSLYAAPLLELVDFSFDIKVAGVFADMIQRSVPGYATVLANIGILTRRYVQPDSVCYDLGCSLGAATLAMRAAIKQNGCRIIAVDNAPAMLTRCREIIAADTHPIPVELVEADINKIVLENASVVVLNLTLQFVPPLQRTNLLSNIYRGLLPGGVLLLAEKICFDDPAQNAAMIEWHHDFKRANGYSELEISQKRSALEKVLLPETMQSHVTRLQQAGFDPVYIWFQCFNFMALLAFK